MKPPRIINCTVCGEPLQEDTRHPRYRHHAGACHTEYRRKKKKFAKASQIRRRRQQNKRCLTCGLPYSPHLFYSTQVSHCKTCHTAKQKDVYAEKKGE